jgi:hypothetical protein
MQFTKSYVRLGILKVPFPANVSIVRNYVTVQGISEYIPAIDLHKKGEYIWLPREETLWAVPGSRTDIELLINFSIKSADCFESLYVISRDEARCVVALELGDRSLGYCDRTWCSSWQDNGEKEAP